MKKTKGDFNSLTKTKTKYGRYKLHKKYARPMTSSMIICLNFFSLTI